MTRKPQIVTPLEISGVETCSLCRHYNAHDERNGECHRYPPTPFVVGFANNALWQAVPRTVALWPMTQSRYSCGEFKFKPTIAEEAN